VKWALRHELGGLWRGWSVSGTGGLGACTHTYAYPPTCMYTHTYACAYLIGTDGPTGECEDSMHMACGHAYMDAHAYVWGRTWLADMHIWIHMHMCGPGPAHAHVWACTSTWLVGGERTACCPRLVQGGHPELICDRTSRSNSNNVIPYPNRAVLQPSGA